VFKIEGRVIVLSLLIIILKLNNMYLEIIQNIVEEILKDDKISKNQIIIQLTPTIYNAVQYELNFHCSFSGLVPIEEAKFESIKLYNRTVTLRQTLELDSKVEKKIVMTLAKITVFNKNNT